LTRVDDRGIDKPMDESPTNGAKRLQRYLAKKKLSISAFCDETGLDRIQISRLLRGFRGAGHKITVRFAFAIERATDGAVPMKAWVDKPTKR
jgi:transcriptional regulator with XRE-family HTH domain